MISATIVAIGGAFNARVFGGNRPWLLRSSALDALTPAGVDALRRLGVTRVVDLRSPGEGGSAAHDIDVVSVPTYRPGQSVPLTGQLETIFDRVLEERGTALATAVAAIAEAPDTVAVHCTIGKDRTGLIVALTLLICGARPDDIVADYARSGPEVLPHRRAYVTRALSGLALTDDEREQAWRLNVQSPPEVMHHLLQRIDASGGAEQFLRRHGLLRSHVEVLRARGL